MATTAETYRIGGRNPRYTTKLSTFANGMYLTEQVLPEGYAKALVNYDIADTGSNVHPKYGRTVYDTKDFASSQLEGLMLTDYLYEYSSQTDEVESTQDVMLSFGAVTTLTDLGVPPEEVEDNMPFYLCSMIDIKDNIKLDKPYSPGWGLLFDESTALFHPINTDALGGISARALNYPAQFGIDLHNIKNAEKVVYRPIYTILDNELYAFSFGQLRRKDNKGELLEVAREGRPVLSKIKIINDQGEHKLEREPIVPMQVNPVQVPTTGFNMLSDRPYSFIDTNGVDVNITGILCYLDDTWEVPSLNHEIGREDLYRIYYGYPDFNADMRYKIEKYENTQLQLAVDADVEWVTVQDWTKVEFPSELDADGNPNPSPVLSFMFTPERQYTNLRVTVCAGDPETDDGKTSQRAMTYYIDTSATRTSSTSFKNFDLSYAKGMISWSGYIGLYGIPGAENTIMFSTILNPSYFPYPHNVLEFDSNILAVYNYLENLLVVTVDGMWLVQLGVTVNSSIKTRVLSNIFISELDATNIQILKDEVFFKTDDQFYVLKPNKYTADSTNLKSYSNSTAVAELTGNFMEGITTIINDTYRHIFRQVQQDEYDEVDGHFTRFTIHDVYSILRNEEVFYSYLISPVFNTRYKNGDELVDQGFGDVMQLDLIYNTITRSWRMYMAGVGDINNTGYTPLIYKGKQSGSFYNVFGTPGKVVVAKQDYKVLSNRIDVDDWFAGSIFENYQFINTGAIALDDTFTKRFREVQFNILNKEDIQLEFKTEFLLDGMTRIDYTQYLIQHITDVNDPDYGHIFVTPIETDNMFVAGKTTLDFWNIDFSKFPDLALATVRFQLQGRGRRGQLKILGTSLKDFELANLVWVYRTMSAR